MGDKGYSHESQEWEAFPAVSGLKYGGYNPSSIPGEEEKSGGIQPFIPSEASEYKSNESPSLDAADLGELASSYAMRPSLAPEPWLAATAWRGIGRDYLQAINDVQTGKVTEADRDQRIQQSSDEAGQYWGQVAKNATEEFTNWEHFPLVSAMGMAGPLGESANLVRPTSIQNPPSQ